MRLKRILITGASGGIGQAIARALASPHAFLGLHYATQKNTVIRLQKELRSKGFQSVLLQADLKTAAGTQHLIRSFLRQAGGIDVLVNNAGGVIGTKHFLELDEKAWDATFALNSKSAFFLTQAAFKSMQRQKMGKIINISSIAAKYGGSSVSIHYGAAKGAMEAWSAGMARAGAPHNILVNVVRCGYIETDFHRKMGRKPADRAKRIQMIPLRRAGKPEDVAEAVQFLASGRAEYITGQVLSVSGGD